MSKRYGISHNMTYSLNSGMEDHVKELKRLLMKRLTWMVLIAYTALMFRPAMPVVMDVLAHTFWEQQHMLTVHEVNGKFHVHNELVDASHQSDKDKQSSAAKAMIDEYLPVKPVKIGQQLISNFSEMETYLAYNCFYPSSSSDLDVPPPRA